MARTLTAGTIAQSTQRLGSEPIVIVKVDWQGGTKYYGDKSFTLGTLTIEGRIINFGTINSKINDRTYGGVDSANITLCDIDGDLKTIFDSEIIEKIPVTIYHHFEGLIESDLARILVGKIMSPIVWSEGERTLSFEIGNDWNSEDLLLELKETSVDFPSEDDIGKVFPLCFGTVLRLPGVATNRVKTGKLLTGIYSWTTWYKPPDDPDKFKFTLNQNVFEVTGFEDCIGQEKILEIDDCLFRGVFETDRRFRANAFNSSWYANIDIGERDPNDVDYDNASCAWVAGVGFYNLTGKYVHIRMNIKSCFFDYIDEAGVPRQTLIDSNEYATLKDAKTGANIEVRQRIETISFVAQISSQDDYNNKIFFSRPCQDQWGRYVLLGGAYDETNGRSGTIQETVGKLKYTWSQLPDSNSPLRWDIGPGARVREYDPTKPPLHVFNSVASNEVFEVTCKWNGALYLLPQSSYVVTLAHSLNVNGETEILTTLYLNNEDKMMRDGWDINTIYASLKSSINSNTATDVINWIALNRTDLIPDNTNFTAIGTLIANYPSHFAYLTQRDALAAIQEISWLARLGVFIDAGNIFLHYLAKEPTSHVFEAIDENIRLKSMEITKTSSDDIYTKFTSLWNFTYEESEKRKIKSENNVLLYGEENFEIDNVIYNIESLVQKCHDFWLNRKSNCWYTLEIDTFLTSLNVQIWDAILVNVSFINDGTPIRGHVIGIGHDSVTHQIILTIWLPIKQGEGDAYQDDSGDVMPDDPGEGLGELDYALVPSRPTLLVGPSMFKKGRERRKDSENQSDYQRMLNEFLNVLEYGSFQAEVLELYPDCMLCRVLDANGFDSKVIEYAIKNNIFDENNQVIVALPEELRESFWKDITINLQWTREDTSVEPAVTKKKILATIFERALDLEDNSILNARWMKPQDDARYKDEYQMIAPPYVVQDAPEYLKGAKPSIINIQYQPKGTGASTLEVGKIVWQDINTAARAYAFVSNTTPEDDD